MTNEVRNTTNGDRAAPAEPFDPDAPGLGGERVVEGLHYGWLMRDHLDRYHFAARWCRDRRVLDVATGTGYGANILRRTGAAEVVAVDREADALAYARNRYGEDGLSWVEADAYRLPFEAEFDVVVTFETIEHLKEPERFIEECKRVLKPDGVLLVSTPLNTGGPFVSDYHELEFSLGEFRRLLGGHFSSVEIMGQRRDMRMPFRLLGWVADWYWETTVKHGRGSHRLFTVIDRLNKLPNYLLAAMLGMNEEYRRQIRPIDEPARQSLLLKPNYFVMIGICTDSPASAP